MKVDVILYRTKDNLVHAYVSQGGRNGPDLTGPNSNLDKVKSEAAKRLTATKSGHVRDIQIEWHIDGIQETVF